MVHTIVLTVHTISIQKCFISMNWHFCNIFKQEYISSYTAFFYKHFQNFNVKKPILLFYSAEQNKHELSCLLFSLVTIHHDRSPTTKTVAYVNKQKKKYIYIYTHTHTHTHKREFLFLSECSIILLRYVCITHPYFFPKIPPPWHWQQSLANDGAELWFECQISKVSNTFIHTA